MTDRGEKNSTHAPLPAIVADKLLEMLSTDDDFRSLFQENPAAALARLGHAQPVTRADNLPPSEGDAFYCMTSNKLASKEEIAASREELKHFLTAQSDHHVVFCFEAGKITSTLRAK